MQSPLMKSRGNATVFYYAPIVNLAINKTTFGVDYLIDQLGSLFSYK